MAATSASAADTARARYERDGFHLVPGLVPRALVDAALPGVADVVAGRYETGMEPVRCEREGPGALVKIDAAHISDRRIRAVATHPSVGAWAAALTGARRVQIWASQLLVKPPGGGAHGHVGWHQDYAYWRYWEPDSELLTAWIALSDVRAESGPMRFLLGSHHWGFRQTGDFFSDQAVTASASVAPDGSPSTVVPVLLPPGGASFHHRLTVHGSGDNVSEKPRIALALHLRTERSRTVDGARAFYIDHLDDERYSPVIHQAPGDVTVRPGGGWEAVARG